jgi:peptidoglycan-associated lipoprotein
MTVLKTSALCVAFSVALAVSTACGKKAPDPPPAAPPPPTPTAPATPPAPPPPPAPAPSSTSPSSTPLTEEQIFSQKTLDQLNAERPLGDVFFDLDAATVREDARGPLQKNADWMKRWSATRIVIEGHCDERGSAEYNLGLGERRAAAVKDYLVNLGVPADRIAVVSKGKESPFCSDTSESCWQQNRRGHFLITAK